MRWLYESFFPPRFFTEWYELQWRLRRLRTRG